MRIKLSCLSCLVLSCLVLSCLVLSCVIPSSLKCPSWTILNDLKTAPSSCMDDEWGGMEPGVMPPISAW